MHVIAHLWRSETACRGQCSPFTIWVPGIELRCEHLVSLEWGTLSFIYLFTYLFLLYKVALSSSDYPGTCDIGQASLILTKTCLSLSFREQGLKVLSHPAGF